MAIYAQRSGSINLAGVLDTVLVQEPVLDGAILVWHEDSQSFVLKSPSTLVMPIRTVSTFNGENVHTVNGGVSGENLHFKEIKAGSGVSIQSNATELLISSNLSANTLSVAGSYKVTIDNDAQDPNATFEVYTAGSPLSSPKYIDFSPVVLPVTIPYLYTENESSRGAFKTINGFDFISAGFLPGQIIKVTGSVNQDNYWEIYNVETYTSGADVISKITLVEMFEGEYALNLGGPTPNVEIVQLDLFVSIPAYTLPYPYDNSKYYQLSSVSVDFGPSGYNLMPGMIVRIANSLNSTFDGTYTVDSITAKGPGPFDYSSVLFKDTSPLPEYTVVEPRDPLNPDLRFIVEHFEASTGFSVNKTGEVNATNVKVASAPQNSDDLTNKSYVDSKIDSSKRFSARLYYLAGL
jgi:hypothetical protein